MGSRLLNGSPQLNVRVIAFPLLLIMTVVVTLGTILGMPKTNSTWFVCVNIMCMLLFEGSCIVQATIYNLLYCEGIAIYLMV